MNFFMESSVNHPCLFLSNDMATKRDVTRRFLNKREEKRVDDETNNQLRNFYAHKEKLFSSLIASQLARNVRQITCSRWELWLAAYWQITDSTSSGNCWAIFTMLVYMTRRQVYCAPSAFSLLHHPRHHHDISSPINFASVECFPLYLAQIAQSASSD